MADPTPIRKSSAPAVPRIGVWDTLQSWLTGMMISGRDKTASTRYFLEQMTPDQLEEAFRSSWLVRKIVTIPAWDATREWRSWQAKDKQIEKLEEVEKKFSVQTKVRDALIKARLYGGAGIVIGTGKGDADQTLEPERIGQDGISFLHVVTRHELSAGPLEDDIESEWFGIPKWYNVYQRSASSSLAPAQRIHPSRVVRFIGNDAPSLALAREGWGDPVLWVVNDAVRAAGITSQSLAQMIFEAKVDFIHVPDLTNIFASREASDKYVERMSLINSMKSTSNAVLLDKDEEWERTQITFTGMPDVLRAFLLIASGAADIPATRLLGQSPMGLNATGDSDTRNYYDRIKSEQSLIIQPALNRFDQCLQMHALGKIDEDIHYEWTSLWQMDEEQKAKIDKTKAETTKIYVDTGVVPFEALAKGVQNMLIEEGTFPGLEAALKEAEAAGDFIGEPLPLTIASMKQPALPAPFEPEFSTDEDEEAWGEYESWNEMQRAARSEQEQLRKRARGSRVLEEYERGYGFYGYGAPTKRRRSGHGYGRPYDALGKQYDIGWTEEARQASIEARRANAKGESEPVEIRTGSRHGETMLVNQKEVKVRHEEIYQGGVRLGSIRSVAGNVQTSAVGTSMATGRGEVVRYKVERPGKPSVYYRTYKQARAQFDSIFTDREARPLYVRRDVKNARELRAWAASQGFKDLVPDLHVTVLYSKTPVDWVSLGGSAQDKIIVPAGGPRVVEALGDDGAVVLHFACNDLQWRHSDMVARGASHDYDEYQPHITISYNKGDVDLEKVEPYRGRIILGSEIFEDIKTEDAIDEQTVLEQIRDFAKEKAKEAVQEIWKREE